MPDCTVLPPIEDREKLRSRNPFAVPMEYVRAIHDPGRGGTVRQN